jgi:hypothetical protein
VEETKYGTQLKFTGLNGEARVRFHYGLMRFDSPSLMKNKNPHT